MSTKKIPPNRPQSNPAPSEPLSNRHIDLKREVLQRQGDRLLEALEEIDADEEGILDLATELREMATMIRFFTDDAFRVSPCRGFNHNDWQIFVAHLGRNIQGAAHRLAAIHKLRRAMSYAEGLAVDELFEAAPQSEPAPQSCVPMSGPQSKRASVRRVA